MREEKLRELIAEIEEIYEELKGAPAAKRAALHVLGALYWAVWFYEKGEIPHAHYFVTKAIYGMKVLETELAKAGRPMPLPA